MYQSIINYSTVLPFIVADTGCCTCLLQEADKYGITPVLAAIYEGHTACVQLLLSKVLVDIGLIAICMTKLYTVDLDQDNAKGSDIEL